MFVNFYNNLKPHSRFAVTGFFSGLACLLLWIDIDDYKLILTTMPGWLFGLVFIITLFVKTKLFSLFNLLKALIWIPVCAVCFLLSVEMVTGDDYGLGIGSLFADHDLGFFYMAGIAGFITTFIMLSTFYVLYLAINGVDIIRISTIASVVSFVGVYFGISVGIILLYVLYHSIISWCLGAAVMRRLNSLEPQYEVE